MSFYNTGNPVPSIDPRDLDDNAKHLDVAIHSAEDTWVDRLGATRKSIKGVENGLAVMQAGFDEFIAESHDEFNAFLAGTQYEVPVAYTAGLSITRATQTVIVSGIVYRPIPGSLPFVTTTFGADAAKWAVLGDASLRQDLASDSEGAGIVAVEMVDAVAGSVAEALRSEGSFSPAGKQFGRYLKYSTGPIPTSALKVIAGTTSAALTTSRIQSALSDGADIYFEPSSSNYQFDAQINTGRAGQVVCGDGLWSKIQQTASGLTLFMATHDDVNLRDLHIHPSPVKGSTFVGFGAYVLGANRPVFERLYFTGGRAGGIGFANVAGGIIRHTRHFQSAVNPATDNVNFTGHDVVLQRSCNDCFVFDVRSVSGIGTTVSIQPGTTDPSNSNNNVLSHIYSKDQCIYGIQLYTHDQAIQFILNTQIIQPVIDGVSGLPLSTVGGNKPFGAGIYIQGAEQTDVHGGLIKRTNLNTDNETLAPGGIGILNSRGFRINGAVIESANYHGVHVSCLPSVGDPLGKGIIEGVTATKSAKQGLNVAAHNNLRVSGSTFSKNIGNGIQIRNTVADTVYMVISDTVANGNTQSGINTAEIIERLEINDCETVGNNVHGISTRAKTTIINGGSSRGNVVNDGINVTADVLNGYAALIEVKGNGRYGVINQSAGFRVEQSAVVSGNTSADFAGLLDNGSLRTLASSTTPSVAGGDNFKTDDTTEITSFTSGSRTQEITVYWQHSKTILGEALTSGAVRKYKFIGGIFRKIG